MDCRRLTALCCDACGPGAGLGSEQGFQSNRVDSSFSPEWATGMDHVNYQKKREKNKKEKKEKKKRKNEEKKQEKTRKKTKKKREKKQEKTRKKQEKTRKLLCCGAAAESPRLSLEEANQRSPMRFTNFHVRCTVIIQFLIKKVMHNNLEKLTQGGGSSLRHALIFSSFRKSVFPGAQGFPAGVPLAHFGVTEA